MTFTPDYIISNTQTQNDGAGLYQYIKGEKGLGFELISIGTGIERFQMIPKIQCAPN